MILNSSHRIFILFLSLCLFGCKCGSGNGPEIKVAAEPDPNPPVISLPCSHDPLIDMELAAPSNVSKKPGALWGCWRYSSTTCSMPKGNRPKRHRGIDLKAAIGTNIYAMYSGKVLTGTRDGMSNTNCDDTKAHGNRVIIQSVINGTAYDIFYCHLTSINANVGDNITENQIIGTTGTSGNACHTPNPHLHVEIKRGNLTYDPEDFMYTQFDDTGVKTKTCR